MTQAELSEEQVNEIIQGIKIPPQPQILVDLQIEQMDPDISRIAALIRKDVGLAGTILKVVNSPIFALPNQITSVEQAVSLLGPDQVINIVNGLAIKSELSDEAIVNMNRFWDSASDIAMASTHICKHLNLPYEDLSYLLGLFHNAGIPLMMARFKDYLDIAEKSYSGDYERIIDAENEHYQTNHSVMGYYIARSWKLPAIIGDLIAEHHNAQMYFLKGKKASDMFKHLLAILKTAEHLCGNYKILGNQEQDFEWESLQQEILTWLGIGEYDLEHMQENFIELGIGGQNYAF